ncbi:MAG: lysozyme family protein [Bacillaceae bacterium]
MSSVGQTAKNVAKYAIKKKLNIATLKWKIIIVGVLIAVLLFVAIIAGVVSSLTGSDTDSGIGGGLIYGTGLYPISAEVEQYRGDIQAELEKYGMDGYTDLLLALMMQESGGRGSDPMQASESKCGFIGCITNPKESIVYGVKHFISVFNNANKDIKLTLQSYNFGGGFINFVMKNGGKYTFELAVEFSQMMYNKLAHTGIYKCHRPSAIKYNACYGDIEYVDAVLKYLPAAAVGGGGIAIEGMGEQFNIVFGEMKKYEGFPYTFGGTNPSTSFDCSSLMQWGFRKIGVNLPRTAQEQYNASQKISASELKPGDLIFFTRTYNAGRPVTHVGLYIGNGMMFDANGGGIGFSNLNTSYWQEHLYGYGRIVDFKS